MTTPLSVLDLSVLTTDSTTADALAETTALARAADQLGYRRFWVAEHHNMRSVASTSPAVLIAHLAAATRTIRIGSGGVMLPNHSPLVVAEQFAMLEALHPGRIDLGIGRSAGTDPETADVLRRAGDAEFTPALLDVLGLLGDPRVAEGLWERFRATPLAAGTPDVMLLGAGESSALLAAELGLPFVYGLHLKAAGSSLDPIRVYRDSFIPSLSLKKPYVIVSVSAVVAGTDEEAVRLANPHRLRMLEMVAGMRTLLLQSPEAAAAHPHLDKAMRLPLSLITGAPRTVATALDDLVTATNADELMVVTVTHGREEKIRGLTLLAAVWAHAVEAAH
ncbi:MsnO8 family LLM class oxidoreductase [Lentzea sp. NPDC005914]|uniref:MsnO8 family LLM class oxidoreductase n=1 Tax=Lentzea sp. NPDC005914 TaxID=3154572 RepID=UPI0033C31D0A